MPHRHAPAHRLRIIIGSVAFIGAALFSSGVAGAHVEPTTTTGEAGRRADIGFIPTHGCSGEATNGIDIQLPDGVVDPIPADIDGWTSRVDAGVVSWEGGPLDDGDEAIFSVNVLLPDTPGVTIYFATIQRCEGGESQSWIQRPDDGSDQSFPAPSMAIVEATGPPGTTTPPVTIQGTSVPPAPTTSTPIAPTTTSVPEAVLIDEDSSTDDSSIVPVVIGLTLLVLAIGGGAYAMRRGRSE